MTNELWIDPLLFQYLERVAPGVLGYTVDHEGELWIPTIYAEHERNGDVGRYLDTLPTDRRVVVPNVVNPILRGMLQRRGFVAGWEDSVEFDERFPIWERPAGYERNSSGNRAGVYVGLGTLLLIIILIIILT